MENDLISVIIPIYNVEKYLSKCIESVINQTYKNIEIILVDDGSPDNCGKICDEYAKIDSRIKVIHKKNGGISDTRNIGIDNSNGKYITFIDSDDYVTNDYIEYLYYILKEEKVDISCCNFELIYDNNKKIEVNDEKEKIFCYSQIEALKELLYQKNIDNSIWGKLYKKEKFDNIRFPYGEIYEDYAVFYKILLECDKVAYSNLKKYIYLRREKSILTSDFGEKDFFMIDVSKEMYKNIISKYPFLEDALNSRIINMDFYLLRRMDKKVYPKEYKTLVNDVKNRRRRVSKDKKIKLKTKIGIYISYISIDLVKYIYYVSKNIKFLNINKYITKYKK